MGASYTWTGKTKKGGRKQVFGELVNMVSVIRGNKTFSIKVKSACIKKIIIDVVEANAAIKDEKTFKHVDHAIREWLRHCQEKLDEPAVDEENEDPPEDIETQDEDVRNEENEEWYY